VGLVPLLVGAGVTSIGCDARDCSVVGFSNRVLVELPAGWTTVGFCVGGRCADELVPPGPSVVVGGEPAEYDFTLTAIDPTGARIVRSGSVRTEAYRVNGSGCEPVTADATLSLATDGSIAVRHP
jgi:hypothetical protein